MVCWVKHPTPHTTKNIRKMRGKKNEKNKSWWDGTNRGAKKRTKGHTQLAIPSSIMVQRQAEPYKIERVQALFTEKVVDYIPDFWNGNDTIIFAD